MLGLGAAACGTAPAAEPAAENAAGASEGEGPPADECSPQAGEKRLRATFDRTTSCAADAVSLGLADKVRLAGRAVADTKRIVDALRPLAAKIGVKDLSSARAILCVRVVTQYLTKETAKDAVKAAAVGLSDGEIDKIADAAVASATLGVSDVFAKYRTLSEAPGPEALVDFLATFTASLARLSTFSLTCGTVLADYGVVSIPSVKGYADQMSKVGVVASIAKCGAAVVGNAVDLATEIECYAKDLEHIREQFAALQNAHDARCTGLASWASNAATRPLLRSGELTKERGVACQQVIHRFGSCLYEASDSRTHSCAECARLCTGFVNGAGSNAYLQPALDAAFAKIGGDAAEAARMVRDAANFCGPDINKDGLRSCVNMCRGQVSDCD